MYVEDIDQRDWNEYAERLTFALNTAQDRVRGDTPFYLLHGWDPRSTLEAMIPLGSTRRRDREPRRWRYCIHKQYQQVREQVNTKLREANQERADRHNETVRPHEIEVGAQVWLYLDRVKEGYARKLAHMWHGPFRWVNMQYTGTEYRHFPVVHVSKLKPVRQFPDRPKTRLTIQDQDRYDFDEALLPEDSWIQDLDNDEYEVEKIVDMRSGKLTDMDVHYANSWCTGKDMTNRRGRMKPILIVDLYWMTICEIDRIEIDSNPTDGHKVRSSNFTEDLSTPSAAVRAQCTRCLLRSCDLEPLQHSGKATMRRQAQCKEFQQLGLAPGRYPWNWVRPYRAPSVATDVGSSGTCNAPALREDKGSSLPNLGARGARGRSRDPRARGTGVTRAGRPTGEDLSPHGRSADGARHGGLTPESLGALETRKSSSRLPVVHAYVRGYGDPFGILIDSGTSTNFARRQTVARNGDKYADALCESEGRGQVSVRLANGTVDNIPGVRMDLAVKFEDFESTESFLVLDMD
ncbi:LOW QUALITY PROTEIN: Reverse transcriptase, partial [Phytophthora palmivora]